MANKKIRQENNFINRIITSNTSTVQSEEKTYNETDVFDPADMYFEVIAINTSGGDETVTPYYHVNPDGTGAGSAWSDLQITIPANTNNWQRFRSSAYSGTYSGNSAYYHDFIISATGSPGDVQIKSAKFIFFQDAAEITATQTQIEVGAYELWEDVASAETYYPLVEPKYWKYEASKWDPTPTFIFGFTALNENDMDVTRIALQESSDAAFSSPSTVTNSIVSLTSETAAYYESSAFTPTDGYYYRVAYTNDNTKYGGTIYNAKVIATQTDATSIDKIQMEYLLINEAQTDTGLQEYQTYYDPAEWDDGAGNPPTFYHEHSASSVSSNTKLQEDPGGTPADITNSDITGDDLTRGGSAMTMPSTAKEIDAYIVTA
jgi:hypothetical protein